MKRVVVIPIEPGKKNDERRKGPRRTSVPRRLRAAQHAMTASAQHVSAVSERRDSLERRRLPDRRLGLKLDLDWSELE